LSAEIAQLRKKLTDAAQPLLVLEKIEETYGHVEDSVAEPVVRKAPAASAPTRAFKLGDKVFISTIATEGVVTSLSSDQAEVQIGRLRVRTKLDELMFANEAAVEATSMKRKTKTSRPDPVPQKIEVQTSPALEIDLRGMRVDDALEELERHLDSAFLVGMPFLYVIHGKGTGRLRQAIRQWLKRNTYVKSFTSGNEAEGGDGVTMIRLKEQ